jgi:RecA/RadA recombinase
MTEIIVAVIALLGTLGGSFGGIMAASRLTNYRIEQLEKKVDKHNSVVERITVVEVELQRQQDDLKIIKEGMHP